MPKTLNELKQEVFDYVRFSLGDGLVDVELDPQHYEQALKQAFLKYRQKSSNSVEESYSFLTLMEDTNTYSLPEEVISVKQIFRATIGSTSTSNATQFEPFESGFLNMYLLRSGRVGGLLSFELFSQYQELAAKMFGGYLNFKYNKVTHELTIMRRQRSSDENVLLWTYNYKPDVTLLSDYMALPWLRDYSLAVSKKMLGEAREKFANIAGPQGGTTLNGSALKAEAQAEIDKLEQDILMYSEGSTPLGFFIG
ncbi:MAG: hypothetical protein LLF94_08010 [Chlamydiales bacterium]|nr:hypothetical protein [Chlamydiales bacterium]